MPDPTLSNDVFELLDCCFASVHALDVLFALRADADRWWSTEELQRAVTIVDDDLRCALADLQERGLVLQLGESHFCSAPLEATAQTVFGELERAYLTDRASLVQHFSRRPAPVVLR